MNLHYVQYFVSTQLSQPLNSTVSGLHGRSHSFYHTSLISLSQFLQLEKEEPEIIVQELLNNLKSFQKILSTKDWSNDNMKIMIGILVKSLEANNTGMNRVFAEILNLRSSQFHVSLVKYVQETRDFHNILELSILFGHLVTVLPSSAVFILPIDALKNVVDENFPGKSCVDCIIEVCHALRANTSISFRNDVIEIPDETYDYREEQILPKIAELIHPHHPPLRANIVEGSYSSWDHYYDTQFRLLREDFMAPLRRGICGYREGLKCSDIQDVRVYLNVKFTGCQVNHNGVFMRVQFDITHLKNVNWEHGKRLIYGSLLCLSHDQFDSIVFATVVERKVDDVKKGIIVVRIESKDSVLKLSSKKTLYTMIESQAHYETYFHILHSLQTAEISTMPFKKYLIDSNCKEVDPPLHISMDGHNLIKSMPPVYDLQNAIGDNAVFNVTNEKKWDDLKEGVCNLDTSQVEALQLSLNKEICVIQGPPGTGKTYIGVKIVEALLINKRLWDPICSSPILVVCFTNHALDQFLNEIIDIMKCDPANPTDSSYKIVRVGGRCSNEKVKNFSIHSFRKSNTHRHFYKVRKDLTKQAKQLDGLLSIMQGRSVPSLNKLKQFISPLHYSQLVRDFEKNKRQQHFYNDYGSSSSDADDDSEDEYVMVGGYNPLEIWLSGKDSECQQHKCYSVEQSRGRGKNKSRHKGKTGTIPSNRTGSIHIQQDAEIAFNDRFLGEEATNFKFVEVHSNFVVRDSFLKYRVDRIKDIFRLSVDERKKLYSYWVKEYGKKVEEQLQADILRHTENTKMCEEVCQECDQELLERVHVIGMTTTGAAKYQHIIQRVKPKIVVVEEAAEVLESHIVSCLTAATQQLILIGDHKQLRPNPNEYYLARDYNLDISLFERLIRAGIPHATLKIQHRMRPEIAGLVCPYIYPKLLNHESVLKYEDVRGVSTNMYFFDHQYPEAENTDLKSHSNGEEAKLAVALCDYFLKQGFSPNKITVLTTYTGQLLKLKPLMPKEKFEGVRVTVVDNFQGEENDIIILSLVRSNTRGNVGFLKTDNRICVALSRAKKGFYCFGNFNLLRQCSELWDNIVRYMEKQGKIGSDLELYCCTHPDKKVVISKCQDFLNVPDGGCQQKCNARLECGHTCALHCHPKDPKHLEYLCKKPCPKKCDHGHPCAKLCYEECPKCMVPVLKTIPLCNHSQHVPCYMHPRLFTCRAPCEKKCPQGHQCNKLCSESCSPCEVLINKQLSCGHKVELPCHVTAPECELLVSKVLPECGHEQMVACYLDPCEVICEKPCTRKLPCGHTCSNYCGEECVERCLVEVKKSHPVCGHNITTKCSANVSNVKCHAKVKRMIPTCGHFVTVRCSDPTSDMICNEKVTERKECGHEFIGLCCDSRKEACQVLVSRINPKCGHTLKLPCSAPLPPQCTVPCSTKLLCGHDCYGTCGECHQGRMHKPCVQSMDFPLPCGHRLHTDCVGISVPVCKDPCKRKCSHRQCTNTCSKVCLPCFKPCEWKCQHYECTKRCEEDCDRPPCDQRCPKQLQCGHYCIGVCGEPCPNICKICHKEKFKKLCKSKYREGGNKYIQLDCGHLLEVKQFHKWIDSTIGESDAVKLIRCPVKNCVEIVNHSFRFNHFIKEVNKHILHVQDPRYSKEADESYIEFSQRISKCIDNCNFQLKSICNEESKEIISLFKQLSDFIKEGRPSIQKVQDILCEHRRLTLLTIVIFLELKAPDTKSKDDLAEHKKLFKACGAYKQSQLFEKETREYYERLQTEAVTVLGHCFPIKIEDVIVNKPKFSRGVWMKCSKGHYYCNPRIPKGFNTDLKYDSCPYCFS